jgi:anthranilate phosphoribosyltransferase
MDDLAGGDAAQNAQVIRDMLNGAPGAYRDIVCLNAAAGLVVGGRAASLIEGARMAAQAIDSGAAKSVLANLVEITNRPAPASETA